MLSQLFPFAKTFGRAEYAARLLPAALISALLLLWRHRVVQQHQAGASLLFLAVLALVLVAIQAQVVARLRDADASVLLSGLVFVPYVNAALALALLAAPSRHHGERRTLGAG